jgi:ABC-2 type transport system permease protein
MFIGGTIPYVEQMIVAAGLTKRYRSTLAVDNLSFEVTPGVVTGFLDNPTSGTTLVNGKPGGDLRWPLREVGALLDAKVVIVIASISLVVSEILTFACFLIGRVMLSGHAPVASLGQPGVLRALILAGAFLALLGMFGLGLGVMFRHTAGAITAFAGVIFLRRDA